MVAPRLAWSAGSATLTAVPSMNVRLDARIEATSVHCLDESTARGCGTDVEGPTSVILRRYFTKRDFAASSWSSILWMSLPTACTRVIECGLNAGSYGLLVGPPATSSTASNL